MTFCEIICFMQCSTLFTLGTLPQNTSNQNFFFSSTWWPNFCSLEHCSCYSSGEPLENDSRLRHLSMNFDIDLSLIYFILGNI